MLLRPEPSAKAKALIRSGKAEYVPSPDGFFRPFIRDKKDKTFIEHVPLRLADSDSSTTSIALALAAGGALVGAAITKMRSRRKTRQLRETEEQLNAATVELARLQKERAQASEAKRAILQNQIADTHSKIVNLEEARQRLRESSEAPGERRALN